MCDNYSCKEEVREVHNLWVLMTNKVFIFSRLSNWQFPKMLMSTLVLLLGRNILGSSTYINIYIYICQIMSCTSREISVRICLGRFWLESKSAIGEIIAICHCHRWSVVVKSLFGSCLCVLRISPLWMIFRHLILSSDLIFKAIEHPSFFLKFPLVINHHFADWATWWELWWSFKYSTIIFFLIALPWAHRHYALNTYHRIRM